MKRRISMIVMIGLCFLLFAAAGAFAGPKDIPQSVLEGSAAAAAVADLLANKGR